MDSNRNTDIGGQEGRRGESDGTGQQRRGEGAYSRVRVREGREREREDAESCSVPPLVYSSPHLICGMAWEWNLGPRSSPWITHNTHHTDAPVRMHLICGRQRAVGSEARLASTVRLRPACLAPSRFALSPPTPPVPSLPVLSSRPVLISPRLISLP